MFLGRDPAVFWNAEIITADMAFTDAVEEAAFNETMSRLDTEDRYQAAHFSTIPNIDDNGKIISYTLHHGPRLKYPQLDGLTFSNFVDKRAQRLHVIILPRFQLIDVVDFVLAQRIILNNNLFRLCY